MSKKGKTRRDLDAAIARIEQLETGNIDAISSILENAEERIVAINEDYGLFLEYWSDVRWKLGDIFGYVTRTKGALGKIVKTSSNEEKWVCPFNETDAGDLMKFYTQFATVAARLRLDISEYVPMVLDTVNALEKLINHRDSGESLRAAATQFSGIKPQSWLNTLKQPGRKPQTWSEWIREHGQQIWDAEPTLTARQVIFKLCTEIATGHSYSDFKIKLGMEDLQPALESMCGPYAKKDPTTYLQTTMKIIKPPQSNIKQGGQ